jgi:dihydroceramidase
MCSFFQKKYTSNRNITVGLGSVAFHGTLYKLCQAFDEVPMLYCVLTFTFIGVAHRYKLSSNQRTLLATSLFLYAVFLTVLVTASEGYWQFILFHLSFNSAHFYALYHAWKQYSKRKFAKKYTSLDKNTKKLHPSVLAFERGAFFYGTAIACWLTDMFACEFINPDYSNSILLLNPQLQ